ncbi:MAG: SDR family oxidoreductase [Acidobacteriota bacterium]
MQIQSQGVFVITGGGGSLAGAVAEVFHAAGARLALIGRHGHGLAERAASFGGLALTADLTSSAQAERAIGETVSALGRIDGLIHTAGAFAMGKIADAGPDRYQRLFEDNVQTLHNAVKAALPELVARGDGFIAGVSSNVVWEGGGAAGMALYAAAKAAVAFYLRSLEREVRERGLRVAIVYPMAPIDTPANRRAMPTGDPEGWVDPVAIAEALLFSATRGRRGRLMELPIWAAR